MKYKVLWYIPSSRTFSFFWDWARKVKFMDKLIVKNHDHDVAHRIASDFFMEHDEYDYLLISSDDVYGTPDHIRTLLRDVEENDYPIMSGWCNIQLELKRASLTIEPVDVTKEISWDSYSFLLLKDVYTSKHGYPFIKVWFTGLPLTLIRRDVLQTVPLRPFMRIKDAYCTTPETQKHGRAIMFDLAFCLDCYLRKIPIIVDTRVFLLHFGGTHDYVRVGKDEPQIILKNAEETP